MHKIHTFAIHTLGCKVNTYESEAMKNELTSHGLVEVNFDQLADVYIINTCSVTNTADLKSRNIIRRANKLNPNAIVIVAGCYSQTSSQEIKEKLKADIIIGNKYKNNIYKLIQDYLSTNQQVIKIDNLLLEKDFEIISSTSFENRTRAFIKIQDGCNFMCSYCSIPFTRGKQRSGKLEDIINQIKKYIDLDFKEIVLTGVNTAGYLDNDNDFYSLLLSINRLDGDFRIRISSIEPFQITDKIIDIVMNNPKRFCNHWHLCLQSGSDEILTAMNRKYTTYEFKILMDKIRQYNPLVSISTDYIVGFPTETDQQHNESLKFIKDVQFSFMHIFTFSKRQNTSASKLEDIHGNIKKLRFNEVSIVDKTNKLFYLKKFVNKEIEVLFEQYINGVYHGKNSEYVEVLYQSNNENLVGKMRKLKVSNVLNGRLICSDI